ncbi:hypothetical protein EDD21DRAFT_412954 [Dissophora ornata]|nr:hypothetical protein BGZ58_006701 [Dissophora ornata]KAI8603517.1 hypothetical protein EDD21DRAFT_412954 [Dissophora ornata]
MLSSIGNMFSGSGQDDSNDSLGASAEVPSVVSESLIQEFFGAIDEQDKEAVRQLLSDHHTGLTRARLKPRKAAFPPELERDAYTLLGAYLGPLTGLQYSILTGRDSIAMDILDMTFDQDIDDTFGSGNTALQLAALLGAVAMVTALVRRGADVTLKNKRNYSAVDMTDNVEILKLFTEDHDE